MIQSKNPRITSISILKDEQASGNGRLAINAAMEQNPAFSFFGKTESARTKWNQFAKELNGTNYRAYNSSNVTATFTDGIAECTVQNSSVSGYQVGVRATDNITIVNGHVYFAFCEINSQKNTSFRVNLNSGSNNFNGGARLTVNTFIKCSVIITASRDYTQFIVSPNEAFSVGQKYSVKNMMLIDLTAIFGSGNEPTTPAAFEAYCEQYGIDLTKYQSQMTDGYTGYVHNNDSVWTDSKHGSISLADYDLREINGIRDEYDASTGTITRRIGKVVLDGTQSMAYASYQRCIVYNIPNVKKTSAQNVKGNAVTDYMDVTTRDVVFNRDWALSVYESASTYTFLLRADASFADVNSYKTFFAEHPLTVYYELETPVTESVQKQAMPAVPGNNVYTQIDGAVSNTPASVRYKGADEITDGIASGTLDIDEMLCNDPLTFGNMCASKFECQLFKDIDVAGKEIEIRQTIDGASIPVFHGYVDSAKKDYSQSYRQIVAYDGAEKLRDADISAFWESFWSVNTTATLKVLISALCASQGYVIDDKRPLGFHDISITKPFDLSGAKMTFGDCLRHLCEICLYHPHISRDGKKIVLNSLNPAGKTINNVIGLYDRANSDFEDYVTKPIERVLFYEDGKARADVGAGNTLVIDNNPILYAFTDAQLATLGNAMLAELKDYGFRPARVEMVISAPDLQLADTIYTEYGRTFILNNRLHGIQLFDQSIRADADEEQAAPIQYNAEVRRKLSQADFTGAAIADKINNAPETVVIEADHIKLNGYTDINGYFSVGTDGKVTLKDCNLVINSGDFSKQEIKLQGTVDDGGYYDGQKFSNAQTVGSNLIKNETTGIATQYQFDGLQIAKGGNILAVLNGTTYAGNTAAQLVLKSTADSAIGEHTMILQPQVLIVDGIQLNKGMLGAYSANMRITHNGTWVNIDGIPPYADFQNGDVWEIYIGVSGQGCKVYRFVKYGTGNYLAAIYTYLPSGHEMELRISGNAIQIRGAGASASGTEDVVVRFNIIYSNV